jgi:predicted PurR-regulated permease PerM
MLVFIVLIIAGDLFGLLSLAPAIPVMAVIEVLIRFLDELYLRSDFHLAPATSKYSRKQFICGPA